MDKLDVLIQINLAFLGIVAPLVAVLFSLFPKGVSTLRQSYEKKRQETLDSIKPKKQTTVDEAVAEIVSSFKTIKRDTRKLAEKIKYLTPSYMIVLLISPFVGSLVGIIGINSKSSLLWNSILFLFSASLLILGLIIFYKLVSVISEVSAVINEEKQSSENKQTELLGLLVEKSGIDSLFLNPDNIFVSLDKKRITKDEVFHYSTNTEQDILVTIHNLNDVMAKNVEVGFKFPFSFDVEKTDNITSIFNSAEERIVRFNENAIQSDTAQRQGTIKVKFLEIGEFPVAVFIKGENIKKIYIRFKINIVK